MKKPKTIEERAKAYSYRCTKGYSASVEKIVLKVAKEAYMEGAADQEKIGSIELTKLNNEWVERTRVHDMHRMERACSWLRVHFKNEGYYIYTTDRLLEDFKREMR